MPMLALGLLKVDKHFFGAPHPEGLQGRVGDFSISVRQANAELDDMMGLHEGVRMLVAPEYYWSDYMELGQYDVWTPRPMGSTKKADLYESLKRISLEAGDLILVTGSIFYRKGGGLKEKKSLSACPVLQNGQIILRNYKIFDDAYTDLIQQNYAMRYVHKTHVDAPIFEDGGITFGIDVCGEHVSLTSTALFGGRLKTWSRANGDSTVDIHILISDGSTPRATDAVASKYVVWTDSDDASVGVYSADQLPASLGQRIPETGVGVPQVNGAVCYYYLLHW